MTQPAEPTRYVEDGGRVESDGRVTFSEVQYDALAHRCAAAEQVVEAQEKLLVAYRLGSSVRAGKAIDELNVAKAVYAALDQLKGEER